MSPNLRVASYAIKGMMSIRIMAVVIACMECLIRVVDAIVSAMSEYQSGGRLFALLNYLTSLEEGATREDVYQHVAGYQDAPSLSAKRRMFERDIRQLEQSGFPVQKVKHRGAIYKIAKKGNEFSAESEIDSKIP
jgi:biotin operon repressor